MTDKTIINGVDVSGCDSCEYCQCRFIKSRMDNDYRCKLMEHKPCFDATIKDFSVSNNVPAWCPLLKQSTRKDERIRGLEQKLSQIAELADKAIKQWDERGCWVGDVWSTFYHQIKQIAQGE